jgi:phosphohistidine phosphatase
MELILIRHAKAENVSQSGKDFDRGLSDKGKEQVKLLATHLTNKLNTIQEVHVSSAKRTRKTYKGIEDLLPVKAEFNETLYLASFKVLLDFICQKRTNKQLVLIGHNEGLSQLASYLLDEDIHMSTAACLHLKFEVDDWTLCSRGTARLVESLN